MYPLQQISNIATYSKPSNLTYLEKQPLLIFKYKINNHLTAIQSATLLNLV